MLLKNFTTIISEKKEEDTLTSILHINENHEVFQGHFPEQSVTPGVLLIQLFKEEAERFLGNTLRIEKTTQIKFLAVVNPDLNNELELQSVFSKKEDCFHLTGKALQNNEIVLKLKLILKEV
ncbi:hydroxymyristoyl-ACP dehydratase [Mesonia ostreae]|uniref:Hydroxymyristoyl-ACP dehydratase n=1 Tax=Mesonia ostreae TaxID=861110 RepID=A0ABU2KI66_9FLAO|nr:hydroxymyristoyl-ACP dehydratase [Mesonia ostreae]MDT0294374.1 hydroxymyristoyl-ACP dehydratase [Mesonia ostreae]